MNVVIHDTSVLVDLAEGGLLELFSGWEFTQ